MADDAGPAGVTDASLETPDGGEGQATQAGDGAPAPDADTRTALDAEGGVDVLGGDDVGPPGDASDGSDGSACGVCTGGTVCQGDVCICPSGLTSCDGVCADEQHDTLHCGGCAVACPPSAACTGGRCLVVLARGEINAAAMAVDATGVYWAFDGYAYGVEKVTTDGLTLSNLVEFPVVSDQTTAETAGIALDSSNVYWTDNGSPGDVMTMATDGGTATTLASGQDQPSSIAVSGASVYWMNGTGPDGGAVMKVSTDGGSPVTLASGVDIPTGYNLPPVGFAVDATSVFFTTSDSVMKLPTGGGTPTVLASAQNGPLRVAVDDTSVYWTNSGDGTVMKVSTDGGTPTTLASGLNNALGIAVDTSSVYWTTADAIMKVLKTGGTPTVLVSGESLGGQIAVDATSVYWIVAGVSNPVGSTAPPGFSVMKLTPK